MKAALVECINVGSAYLYLFLGVRVSTGQTIHFTNMHLLHSMEHAWFSEMEFGTIL